jgi:hypothetical protein
MRLRGQKSHRIQSVEEKKNSISFRTFIDSAIRKHSPSSGCALIEHSKSSSWSQQLSRSTFYMEILEISYKIH